MTTPAIEANPYPASSSRLNGDLPQGLKSTPDGRGLPNPYTHLGFNPVPGNTDTVRDLRKKLASCAKVLEQTHGLVAKLMDGSYWTGDAAVAFRDELQGGPLALNLKNAAHSIIKAARQLDTWEGELDDFQRRAKRLDEDARDARDALDRARGHAGKAKNDPDPGQEGSRHDAAQKVLTHANTAVDNAQSDLDEILGKAKRLAEEHEVKARRRAGKIRDATKKLAPQEPGWLDELGDWITENLPDILSFAAGVIGLVALFVLSGGTAAAALLLAAAALSGGALTMRLSDPEVRASLADGLLHGELDSDFWGNLVGVGGDILGSLPGVGAVGMGMRETVNSIRDGEEVLSLGQKMTMLGSKTLSEASAISDLDNKALDLVVRGARDPAKAGRVVEVSSASLGVATAGIGLLSSAVDAVDSDGIKDSATGVDWVRSALDVGGIIDLAGHVF